MVRAKHAPPDQALVVVDTGPIRASQIPPGDAAEGWAELSERNRDLLHQHNLRITPARMAIMSVLAHAPGIECRDGDDPAAAQRRDWTADRIPGHLTAQGIHDATVNLGIPLDGATVYRTVTTLSELGIVHQVAIAERATRFGLNTPPHHHAICDHCRIVRSVSAERLEAVRRRAISMTGFDIPTNGGITVHGSCPRCAADRRDL
jgi:Fur family ferric uptake transcriptional regulator